MEKVEHRRVVGRIARVHHLAVHRFEIEAETLGKELARGGELVVVAEPSVDVNRAHFRRQAGLAHEGGNAFHGFNWQRRHVLAIVDRKVGFTVRLIRGDGGARHLPENRLGDLLQFGAASRPGGWIVDEAFAELAVGKPEVEGAVLADHRVDRPHARDVIAPSGRSAGHRDHPLAAALQRFERGIGLRAELAGGGQGVVDVEQDKCHRAGIEPAQRFHRPIASATRARWRASRCKPALLRRQSTSSALAAHSRSMK